MAVTDVGHERNHPADGLAVQRGVNDLRSDMAMQADQVKQRLIAEFARPPCDVSVAGSEPNLWSVSPVLTEQCPSMSISA